MQQGSVGLLIVTAPISKWALKLNWAEVLKHVREFLYVYFSPGTALGNLPQEELHRTLQCSPFLRTFVKHMYNEVSSVCSTINLQILLENVTSSSTYPFPRPTRLLRDIDTLLTDAELSTAQQNSLSNLCRRKFTGIKPGVVVHHVDIFHTEGVNRSPEFSREPEKVFPHVCAGGTFDRLHIGHKLLLSETSLLAEDAITVGVTDKTMLTNKVLNELIEPLDDRLKSVRDFLSEVRPQCQQIVVPLQDPFGPSTMDPSIKAIVVSQETARGAAKINDIRKEKAMSELDVYVIDLVSDACHSEFEEEKISSSSMRKRTLGTLLREPNKLPLVAGRTYVVGLTGGIASGKSSVCKRLAKLGAATIDCDKLGHRAYLRGTPAFDEIVAAFGSEVVGEDGEINRRVLGPIVFADQSKLQLLNSIVWPAIMQLTNEEIQKAAASGHEVVVVEAAILLEAGWDKNVHEVWSSIVPPDEVVRRITSERNLDEEQARKRLAAQMSNHERVSRSHVVLSTLWEPEYTQIQVETAWKLLESRIAHARSLSA